jgi:hypothetical protein
MSIISAIGNPFQFPDVLGISGQAGAESAINAAQTNSELLRGFSDQSQANLQPFLDLSNAQLGPLEAGATPQGFFDQANQLRPLARSISQPIAEEAFRDLGSQLGATGRTRSGFAGSSAADIQEDADLSVLLQLQSMLTGRRQQVAGFGQGSGQNLARIGQQSAEQIGQIQSEGVIRSQQALGQGQQNLLSLAGLGSQFIPPSSSSSFSPLSNSNTGLGGGSGTFFSPSQGANNVANIA